MNDDHTSQDTRNKLDDLSDILSETVLGDQKALIDKQTQLDGFEDSASSGSSIHDFRQLFNERPEKAEKLVERLRKFFNKMPEDPTGQILREAQGPVGGRSDDAAINMYQADASKIKPDTSSDGKNSIRVPPDSVDLIVTSPPYWQKRDYDINDQLGQEDSAQEYVENLVTALDNWRIFLRSSGSIFLNIGDTYNRRSITGIPGMFVQEAREDGWIVRNEIIWKKKNGVPSSAKDRLVNRHESIFHIVDSRNYFYDLHGYSEAYSDSSNDVWEIAHDRNTGDHLAPFPKDLVRRVVTLGCPPAVCPKCGHTVERKLMRDPINLDTSRPQARRALEIYNESDTLDKRHLYAIQKVGISDAGKAKKFQDGAGKNSEDVQELADEAKRVLGGYFREFTFPKPTTEGWTDCDCNVDKQAGMVMDPFAGSGTTLEVSTELGYRAVGVDLDDSHFSTE